MGDSLTEQLDAYYKLLPTIQEDHGAVWVIVANNVLIKVFSSFEQAAKYAARHHAGEQVLIRHTGEERETVPFLMVG